MPRRPPFPPLETLSDEMIATIFSFLPLPDLLECAQATRLVNHRGAPPPPLRTPTSSPHPRPPPPPRSLCRAVASTWALSIEGSICDVDPFAALGARGVIAALHPPAPKRGLGPLELLARLGEPLCAVCGDGVGTRLSLVEFHRLCEECAEGLGEDAKLCFNRFLFKNAAVVSVANEEELREAIEVDENNDGSFTYWRTIVLTNSIELKHGLAIFVPVRLRGIEDGVTLSCASATAVNVFAESFVLVESLSLVSGEADFYEEEFGDNTHWPTVLLETGPAFLLLRGCAIQGNVGSAVMCLEGSSAVLENCVVSSQSFYGLICKTKGVDTFFAAAHGCSFRGSTWHISAGAEIAGGEEAALVAANFFSAEADERVTKRDKEWPRGVVQPWRRGWLRRGRGIVEEVA